MEYKLLLTNRNFCFIAIYKNIINIITNTKTLQVILIINNAKTLVKINKGIKLGQIYKNYNSSCYISL